MQTPMPLPLPPHEWDTDTYRTEIHTTFDIWFIHYERGNMRHARRWQAELRKLTGRAKLRKETTAAALVIA